MKMVRPTAKALSAAIARRDRIARDLAELDAKISAAGRDWSRQQGNVFPLRDEALRRSVALALAVEAEKEGRQRSAVATNGE